MTIVQALVIALERGREHGALMFYRDRGAFREYVIGRRRLVAGTSSPSCVVPRTALSRPTTSARSNSSKRSWRTTRAYSSRGA